MLLHCNNMNYLVWRLMIVRVGVCCTFSVLERTRMPSLMWQMATECKEPWFIVSVDILIDRVSQTDTLTWRRPVYLRSLCFHVKTVVIEREPFVFERIHSALPLCNSCISVCVACCAQCCKLVIKKYILWKQTCFQSDKNKWKTAAASHCFANGLPVW